MPKVGKLIYIINCWFSMDKIKIRRSRMGENAVNQIISKNHQPYFIILNMDLMLICRMRKAQRMEAAVMTEKLIIQPLFSV